MHSRFWIILIFFSPMPILAAEPARGRGPNVVLIMTDDQGYGDLGCHGNKKIRTPELDRLHRQSVRLTDFHVTPLCSPTRAALMTGRDNLRCGVWATTSGRSILRSDETTMAQVFAAAGYRTALIGKWHLGDNFPFRPQDRGFHEVFCHGGGGVGLTPDFWNNTYADDTYFANGKAEKVTGYCTDVWFDHALKFIGKNRSQPFFLYLPTNAAHGSHHVPEKWSEPYRKDGLSEELSRYYGMIENIDFNVGRLRQYLEKLGIDRDTIVIFMTDNGAGIMPGGFGAGMRGGKGGYYEGGHRVPCFIHWPAGKLADSCDVPVLASVTDLLPTLTELCELKPLGKLPLDGMSLAKRLRNPGEAPPDRTIFVQLAQSEKPPVKGRAGILTPQWRLVHGNELYDIRRDPMQGKNVAEENPDVVVDLRGRYERWWVDVSKRFGEECAIGLGSPSEPLTTLNAMDWHCATGRGPWAQDDIRKGDRQNGYWAVEVLQEGKYEIALRRWPREAALTLNAAAPAFKSKLAELPAGKALPIAMARLRVGDLEKSLAADANREAVVFTASLKVGTARLQTWFYDRNGKEICAAYFVEVKMQSP